MAASSFRFPTEEPKAPQRSQALLKELGEECSRGSEDTGRQRLQAAARLEAQSWNPSPAKEGRRILEQEWQNIAGSIATACQKLQNQQRQGAELSADGRQLLEAFSFLHLAVREVQDGMRMAERLTGVRVAGLERGPRAYAVAQSFLQAVSYDLDFPRLVIFMSALQEEEPLELKELWAMKSVLQLALLGAVARIAKGLAGEKSGGATNASVEEAPFSALLSGLLLLKEADWKKWVRELSVIEQALRQDPAGAYARMDKESRTTYCDRVVELAAHSSWRESDIAWKAVAMAKAASRTPRWSERAQERRSHVGYYLIGEGKRTLEREVGYAPPLPVRFREWVLCRPERFYLGGIAACTLALIAAAFWRAPRTGPWDFAILALFLFPAAECAVAILNQLATSLRSPHSLPKLDFSGGIPPQYSTMVVVPALLINAEQTTRTVRELEVRYLANRDRNLYFALLTDPPDSSKQFDDKDELAAVCASLIRDLNLRYCGRPEGSFFLFHRNRTYNPAEGRWMGWERKRGKLLEFNRLILGEHDAFPLKVGDAAVLSRIRYVITLDVDTQLPRDAAQKLVGTIAHPLQRAVIDPKTHNVVEGYGILQPRIGISVHSASRSRLAAFFSGDTGFDIYTRAVSDVYQDLFGEGTYTGKGIYEVETFHRALNHRFPCNALLSHDMIEGVYARTGLVSDIEIVDDYPSHFSAFSRRKHRWIRGDWQIAWWLFPRVRDYFGRIRRNPMRLISRWKIVDNLRRSLTEVATFALLLCAWLLLRDRATTYWTLVAVGTLALSTYFQILLSVLQTGRRCCSVVFWKTLLTNAGREHATLFFRLTFLCHQSLAALDAVTRVLVRMMVTQKKLLEWETAAEAEFAVRKKSPVDLYLTYTPLFSLTIAAVLLVSHVRLAAALPFLGVWFFSKWICRWLDRPSLVKRMKLSRKEQSFLRRSAYRTWRYFREFSTPEDNWLIPDTLQETPRLCAHKVSPTNLGFLLSSRLAAYDLGYLTLSETVSMTEKTFESMNRMGKCRGHFYNWYDTRTLEPLPPVFISTVDSGNLVCCLWALKQGLLEAARRPIFRENLWRGLLVCVEMTEEVLGQELQGDSVLSLLRRIRRHVKSASHAGSAAWRSLPGVERDIRSLERTLAERRIGEEAAWWTSELVERVRNLKQMLLDFAPWLLPEFANRCGSSRTATEAQLEKLTLESLPRLQAEIEQEAVKQRRTNPTIDQRYSDLLSFRAALARSSAISRELAQKLAALAEAADACAAGMDFSFLYNPRKELLSIGYDLRGNCLSGSHYDLLASEARAAIFVAIAKGDVPQRSWFHLDRSQIRDESSSVLLSWSGTMFEYLLPTLWMNSYQGTLLDRSARAAVRMQQKFAATKSIPWGISEAACAERYPDGWYRYRAFGVPSLALNPDHGGELVVSAYSAFLAFLFDPIRAIRNLKKLKKMGLLGAYGFYESADFTPRDGRPEGQCEPVRCWMAHHEGMSLISAVNELCDLPTQRRFHAEPLVAATERLLHEKVPPAATVAAPEAKRDPKMRWRLRHMAIRRAEMFRLKLCIPAQSAAVGLAPMQTQNEESKAVNM